MRCVTVHILMLMVAACHPTVPTSADRSPVVRGDSVFFMYRGKASSVHWNGDFNAWGRAVTVHNTGVQVDSTVWTFATRFPADLRTDYKIVVDSARWILDPLNPRQQWGGAGPNSELRMPGWKPSVVEERRTDRRSAPLGPFIVSSVSMGYDVRYRIWLPYGVSPTERYPVLYVTDGHEYTDPRLGNLVHAAEVLIADGRVRPFIIVAVDPRTPSDSTRNRRMRELNANPDYATFITRELPPLVESQVPARNDPEGRALLGTSLGGLFATYVQASNPGYFGHIAAQSPAYWVHPDIFEQVQDSDGPPVRMVLTAGTLYDGLDNTRRMKAILDRKPVNLLYAEANEGHSWGFWRARIPDILIHFFAYEPSP